MATRDASRLMFNNNKPKDFGNILYSFLFIYFRVFKVAGDKVKGDSSQQSFGG